MPFVKEKHLSFLKGKTLKMTGLFDNKKQKLMEKSCITILKMGNQWK